MYGYGRCGVGSLASPQLKFESMEWNTGGSRKTKFKITRTTMITIFWDIEEVMNMDCLHRGMTVSRQCNVDLFLTLQKTIEDGQQGKLRLGVHLQYDNAPVHEPSCHTCIVRLWFQPATTKHSCILPIWFPKKGFMGKLYIDDNELTLVVEEFCRERDFYLRQWG